MEEVEVSQYFICPISLQIMKDPVTAITGITYDRQSIERWLSGAGESFCPVTKQSLPRDSDLTPNHTLRRLIQAWCMANAKRGFEWIPTPKSPVDPNRVSKIIRDLNHPPLLSDSLNKLQVLAKESEKNRKCMLSSGVANSLISLIIRLHKENKTAGLEEALRVLSRIWSPTAEMKHLVSENQDLIESIAWILDSEIDLNVRSHATLLTRKIFEIATPSSKELLGGNVVRGLVRILRENSSNSITKAVLRVLIELCQWGRNRLRIIEANAAIELIELELGMPEKKVTELIFYLLSQLCCCADGRAQFLNHAAGIAAVSKMMLRVSAATDDRAVHIFAMLTKFSATNETLQEMLRVGAVSKLCVVLQADCALYLKNKAREILRVLSNHLSNSPCFQTNGILPYTLDYEK